jgi:hypothetical protein
MFQDAGNRESKPSADVASILAKGAANGEPAIAGWLRSIGAKVQTSGGHISTLSLRSTPITDRELQILHKLPDAGLWYQSGALASALGRTGEAIEKMPKGDRAGPGFAGRVHNPGGDPGRCWANGSCCSGPARSAPR